MANAAVLSWGSGPWVFDTSAALRSRRPELASRWREAADAGLMVACPVVSLELAVSARNSQEVHDVGAAFSTLPQAPITRAVTDAALTALGELAGSGGLRHRVPIADAMVAAAAAERGFDVLHYDHHYDTLATVLNFGSCWIAPPGSLE